MAQRLGLRKAGYLTAAQVAPLLGFSAQHVRVLCQRGILAASRGESGFWRITPKTVEEFRSVVPSLGIKHLEVAPGTVTVSALAERLGYSGEGVRHLCRDGTIVATKTPRGDWRIPWTEAKRVDGEVRENGAVKHTLKVAPQPKPKVEPQPKVQELIVYPKDFPGLLRFFVERSGRSGNSIALDAEIEPSFLSRAVTGRRSMSRATIDAVAGVLKLRDVDHGRLLVAAGLVPRPFVVLGYDECFDVVAETLSGLDEAERQRYRAEMVRLARQYRPVTA